MPSIADLLKPLPDATPPYSSRIWRPVHDAIKEARRADDGAPQGDWTHAVKTANYEEVERIATDALANRGKDLQVAAWLTEAWVHRQGINGLTQGLELLRGLIADFWETLYPEIEDDDVELRAAPLNWVGAKLTLPVKFVPVTHTGLTYAKYEESLRVGYEKDAVAEDRRRAREAAIESGMLTAEAFEEAKEATPIEFWERVAAKLHEPSAALDSLDRISKDKFGETAAPNYSPLREVLDTISHTVGMFIRQRRPEAEQSPGAGMAAEFMGDLPAMPEPPAHSAVAVRGVSGTGMAAVLAKAPSSGPEPTSSDDAIARIVQAANYLRAQEPSSAVPYLVLRALRWGELRDSGDPPDPARLEAPSTEVRRRLRDLARDGQWDEVIEQTESAMGEPAGRAWLDLQRYAATACAELSRDTAAQAIRTAVAALLKDYPDLPRATLSDDTPTANAETRAWIQAFAKPEARADTGIVIEPDGSAGREVRNVDPYDMAMEAARDGRQEDAIEILAREAAQERSGRGRFTRKVQLAQVCLAAGRERLAYPILQSVASEIEARGLEEWEAPEMVSHPLVLLLRCLRMLSVEGDERDRVFAKICCLDPVEAMELEQ